MQLAKPLPADLIRVICQDASLIDSFQVLNYFGVFEDITVMLIPSEDQTAFYHFHSFLLVI